MFPWNLKVPSKRTEGRYNYVDKYKLTDMGVTNFWVRETLQPEPGLRLCIKQIFYI